MFGWEEPRPARIEAPRARSTALPRGSDALPRLRALVHVLFAIAAGAATLCSAQAQDSPRQRLDAVRAALIEIDASFKNPTLSDGDLQRLRADNDPLSSEVQSVIAELTPRLEASTKRLSELTPKSKDKTAETDAAAAELAAEQKTHDDLDADLRSARALALQIDDNNARIGAARRALFARQTFERTSSVVSPLLWASAIHEAPSDVARLGRLLMDALSGAAERLTRARALSLLGLAIAFGVLAAPIRWMARRVIARDPGVAAPGKLRRALAAIWTALVIGGIPLLGLLALSYALDAFDLSDPRLQGMQDALLDGLKLLFVTNALARGLLAPGRPSWRLVAVPDPIVTLAFRFWLSVAAIVAIERLLETAADAIGASLSVTVAARGVGAGVVVILISGSLRAAAFAAAPPGSPPRDGWAPTRTLFWLLSVVLLGAILSGYIAFATFLVSQLIWVAGIGATIYLISVVVDEGAEAVLRPDATVGRSLMAVVGVGREALEQIAVLFEGAARVALMLTGVLLVLAPWGIQSEDMFGNLRAAYFGFRIGNVTVSLSSIVAAAFVFVVVVIVTRAVQSWLASRLLPRTRLDAGIRNSINTIFGYVGVVIALVLGSAQLGLSFQNLAIVAGALSVGIGFGLQSIVNNFLSGLILLWERGVRVGDWVVIGAEQGFVRRISARATEVETFDRATLIVPNATLVSGIVKNWVHNDRVGRILINLAVTFENDADVVREILIAVAKAQDLILSIPAPLVLFNEFGDWGLKFQLVCFVDDIEMAERVRSEMHFDLLRRLKAAKVRLAHPWPEPAEPAAARPAEA
jgi:small-conductance mechanosensitive channel